MPMSPLLRGTLAGSPGATTPQQVIKPGQVAPLPGTNLTSMGPAPAGAISGSPAPAAPAAPDYNQLAKEQVDGNLAAGMEWAQSVLPDGSLTRLSDPRAAEMNALLAQLKERTGGMTQQEMLAQQENGIASTDQLLAQNMRRAGDIGAASGVRGGAVAGLKMDALRDSTQARAAFQRQLILDNIAQKNRAFAAYGNTLVHQQGTELGINKYNAGKDDAEKVGRIDLANQYGGMVDSTASSRRAEDRAKEATDISKSFGDKVIEILEKQGGGSGTQPSGSFNPSSPVTKQTLNSAGGVGAPTSKGEALGEPGALTLSVNGKTMVRNLPGYIKPEDVTNAYKDPRTGVVYYDLTSIPDNKKRNTDASGYDRMRMNTEANENNVGAGEEEQTLSPAQRAAAERNTVICTEALRQRLVDQETYDAARGAESVLGFVTLRNYWVWGVPTVRLMRKSRALSKAISWFLPDTVAALHGRTHGCKGTVGKTVFYTLTTLVKLLRKSAPSAQLNVVR